MKFLGKRQIEIIKEYEIFNLVVAKDLYSNEEYVVDKDAITDTPDNCIGISLNLLGGNINE